MSLSIEEWEKQLGQLESEELQDIAIAISTLEKYDLIVKHYGWVGLGTIRNICEKIAGMDKKAGKGSEEE